MDNLEPCDVSFDPTESLDAVMGFGPERGERVMRVLICRVTDELPPGAGFTKMSWRRPFGGEGQDDRPDRRGAVVTGVNGSRKRAALGAGTACLAMIC